MDQNEVDEFLEHHGVKGMHWGTRKSERQARNQSIHDARARNASREDLATHQVAKLNLATTTNGKKSAAQALAKLMKDAENSGDNKLAAQRTSGEKAANAVLLTAGAVLAAKILLS